MLNFTQAAGRCGFSDEEGLRYYVTGAGKPKFPDPALVLGRMKYYNADDVLAWNRERLELRKKNASPNDNFSTSTKE